MSWFFFPVVMAILVTTVLVSMGGSKVDVILSEEGNMTFKEMKQW